MSKSSADAKQPIPPRLGTKPWLLALAVLLGLGVIAVLGWLLLRQADGTEPAQPGERIISSGGVQVSVPEPWVEYDPTESEACQKPGLLCVTLLQSPQGYYFHITRYEQQDALTSQQVDEREWNEFMSYYAQAVLMKREDIEIGGLPAVEREFLRTDPNNAPLYLRQVFVARGLYYYILGFGFPSAEVMDAERTLVDQVLQSIQFTGDE